jgi:hypothetical protein
MFILKKMIISIICLFVLQGYLYALAPLPQGQEILLSQAVETILRDDTYDKSKALNYIRAYVGDNPEFMRIINGIANVKLFSENRSRFLQELSIVSTDDRGNILLTGSLGEKTEILLKDYVDEKVIKVISIIAGKNFDIRGDAIEYCLGPCLSSSQISVETKQEVKEFLMKIMEQEQDKFNIKLKVVWSLFKCIDDLNVKNLLMKIAETDEVISLRMQIVLKFGEYMQDVDIRGLVIKITKRASRQIALWTPMVGREHEKEYEKYVKWRSEWMIRNSAVENCLIPCLSNSQISAETKQEVKEVLILIAKEIPKKESANTIEEYKHKILRIRLVSVLKPYIRESEVKEAMIAMAAKEKYGDKYESANECLIENFSDVYGYLMDKYRGVRVKQRLENGQVLEIPGIVKFLKGFLNKSTFREKLLEEMLKDSGVEKQIKRFLPLDFNQKIIVRAA